MLGLSSGLPYEGIVVDHPGDIDGLVAWWDFTDSSSLWQDIDGFDVGTEVTTQEEPIGRCKNKAYVNDQQLGRFIRASTDLNRPIYYTNGVNDLSYAYFAGNATGGTTNEHLIMKSDSTDWGADSTDVISALPIINSALSIWIIADPGGLNDSSGNDETVLSYRGWRGTDTSYADEEQSTSFAFQRETDDDIKATWYLTSSGSTTPPVSPNAIAAVQSFSHWDDLAIINIQTKSGIGASNIYNNNKPDVGETVFDTNSAIHPSLRQEGVITLDNSVWDDSKVSKFCVGANYSGDGDFFNGKIYEILIYSISTPNESQRASLNSYFAQKYSITLQ